MPDDFDPYYHWLGIPPRYQPPHHYRLLGVELFESHLDVISSAADQRMAHVRSFQSGQRGKISQQLLNELSAARLCLLDPGKKAAYDAALRSQLAAGPAVSPAAGSSAVNMNPSVASVAPIAANQEASTATRAAAPMRKQPPGKVPSATSASLQAAEPAVTARDLLSDIRAASRLTVLEAERLRLTKFDLPAAAKALGEQIYRAGRLRSDMLEQFTAIDPWKPPAATAADAVAADASGEAAPSQAAGDVVILVHERAIALKRGREIDNLFRALGEEGLRRFGDAAGPAEVTGPLRQLQTELARVEAEISELSKRRPGRVFNTRWLALLGCTVLAAVLLLLIHVPFRLVLLLLIVAPIVFAWREFSRSRRPKSRAAE